MTEISDADVTTGGREAGETRLGRAARSASPFIYGSLPQSLEKMVAGRKKKKHGKKKITTSKPLIVVVAAVFCSGFP